MRKTWTLAIVALIAAACGTPRDPPRPLPLHPYERQRSDPDDWAGISRTRDAGA